VAKILIALVIAVLVWFFFIKPKPGNKGDAISRDREPNQVGSEKIVLCSVCGVNIPESEAVTRDGRTACADPATCKSRPDA
jgi:hypothetical protein